MRGVLYHGEPGTGNGAAEFFGELEGHDPVLPARANQRWPMHLTNPFASVVGDGL